MLTNVLRIDGNTVTIPGLDKYKGKIVEITVKEKKKQNLKRFFSLCGKISIDETEIEKFREESYI